ncbi:hypothetical protein CICLE_v10013604mg [Citrus x clementina]|uniref:Protein DETOXIFICATION n=1 Tax=Citrus clementina TaxID=85681 RepID=V4ST86_CITCL|nr:hypothetical protein CICLE_v10013604mg [Citrus x clementina]
MEVPLLPEREEERKWVVVVLPRLSFLEELKTLSFLSAPPAGVACFRFFLLATATMMVGHLGKLSLDSIAIANSLINVIGSIPLFGFASALETLCGQAYGAEQYQKIGTYTYPAMFFCIAICQDPDFFVEACNYAIWLILTLFGYAILRSLSHNLQAQSLILALFLSSCATLCLQILLCWGLVSKTDFGNTGAELTIGISYCTRVANELGAGNPEPARLSTCVVIFLAVAEAAIGSVALFCCRNVLAYLFNTDKDVVNYVSELVPLLSTAIFMDSMQSHIGAYVNLGAFYLVGIPVASVLCFVLHLRTKGLLLGLIINARLNCRNCARHRYFFNNLGKTAATLARERIIKGASSTDNRSVRCKTM